MSKKLAPRRRGDKALQSAGAQNPMHVDALDSAGVDRLWLLDPSIGVASL